MFDQRPGFLIATQIFLGLGCELVIQNCLIPIQADYAKEPDMIPQTSALVNFAQYFGGSLGIAIAGTIFSSQFGRLLSIYAPDLPPKVVAAFKQSVEVVKQLDPVVQPSAPQQQPSAPGRPRRSQSEDSSSQDIRAARAASSRTRSNNAVPRAMDKPSQHADIIDQMDISGLGMFHHDGPFDAVAPSRNRQHKPHRAPVYAFEPGGTGPHNVPVVDKRLSPLAQATIAAMASSDGPYASANLLPAGPGPDAPNDSFPRGARITPTRKMTLTEAWGKAEPEPFEEFSAGTIGAAGRGSARSSLDEAAGYDAYSRRPNNARRGDSGKSSVELPRRTRLPPPQPINLPGARAGGNSLDEPPSSPTYNSDYGPSKDGLGRKKSLLQRFRKMRENPNVPVGGNDGPPSSYPIENSYREPAWTPGPQVAAVREETEPSPSSEVPRYQNYPRNQQPRPARPPKPVSPASSGEEPYVLVDGAAAASAAREKALPPPPGAAIPQANNGYFDRVAGADMTRKQSLYKKMKGAVVRNGAK
ncbi:hypothetical protein FRB90_007731 [Tulasnella sp. 427]|nr:hypothetical protein FRB90_007731 [Tulasnella sp. 427]